MSDLTFVKLRKRRKLRKAFMELIMPYCRELDKNVGRVTPDEKLLRFAESIVGFAGDRDRIIEICFVGDEPIGFLYGKIDREGHRGSVRPGWGYVLEFYVQPKYRRQSYGRKMYQHLESIFAGKGVTNIWLTADPVTGEPFWTAMGFFNSQEKSAENGLYIFEKFGVQERKT